MRALRPVKGKDLAPCDGLDELSRGEIVVGGSMGRWVGGSVGRWVGRSVGRSVGWWVGGLVGWWDRWDRWDRWCLSVAVAMVMARMLVFCDGNGYGGP